MIKRRALPGGIEGEIRRLEIKSILTDDPKEKEKILRRLSAARECRAFLNKLPGQNYLTHDGGHIHTA